MNQPQPFVGLLRRRQILGDRRASPPVQGIIPIGPTQWHYGVQSGRYPPPLRLTANTSVWRAEYINALVEYPTMTWTEIVEMVASDTSPKFARLRELIARDFGEAALNTAA